MAITFGHICSLLQNIENVTSQTPRVPPKQEKERTRQTISNWFANHRKKLHDPTTNGSAVLSILFPYRRKDRVYNLGPPRLARKLVNLLGLNQNQRALFDGWISGVLGDLGVYTEQALRSRDGTFRSKQQIPIEKVNFLLIQMAAKCRFSDKSIRAQGEMELRTDTELKKILLRLESWEAKWLVRLLLREYCTITIDENYLLQQYHFLLPDLLKFQNDFEIVFKLLQADLSCYPANPSFAEENRLRIKAAKKLHAVVGVKVGRPTFYKAWSFKHCFQLVGERAWLAEVKYDGEYCEIHIDLDKDVDCIKIFSKNGKDATTDRKALHGSIREALRIGSPSCRFKKQCIVLGEMVVYSDREKKIMPFSKVRKHISRSGSFIGTDQDSLPHAWEHLMIVFFDVLKVDDKETMRHGVQDRRTILRDLVRAIPGRSMRSEWTLLDCSTADGIADLKQTFARSLADHQEGLVLKPLHTPYFPLLSDEGHVGANFFIKLKKDYLADMGGARDLGDFPIIGASFDAHTAPKISLRPLHWTHFHLGCCTNIRDVQRLQAKPRFKVVASLSLDKCISKQDVKFLNIQGYVRQSTWREDGSTKEFDIEPSNGFGHRMTVVFKQPFVAEVLGSGFEKLQNENFEMLRHPRVNRLHQDRSWEDTVTMEELEQMAEAKWEVPDADKLDGHAKDVALLVKKYEREARHSQVTMSTEDMAHTTQQTPCSTKEFPEKPPSDDFVMETQQQTCSTVSTSQWSANGNTPSKDTRASGETRLILHQNTGERLRAAAPLAGTLSAINFKASCSSVANSKGISPPKRKRSFTSCTSPPKPKQRKILGPLDTLRNCKATRSSEFEFQEYITSIRKRVEEGADQLQR